MATSYYPDLFDTLELSLSGGPPWGFRLRGGGGHGPLFVRRIRRRSPAQLGGLHEGDQLLWLNGVSLAGRSHAYAVQLTGRHRWLALRVRRSPLVLQPSELTTGAGWDEGDDGFDDPEDDWEHGGGGSEFGGSEAVGQELPVPELSLGGGVELVATFADLDAARPSLIPFSKLVADPTTGHQRQQQRRPRVRPRYADSAYAGCPGYPTLDERKRMARTVARSLTDPANRGSRGANMFEGRRQRSEKFTLEAEAPSFGTWTGRQEGSVMIDTSVGAPAGPDARDDWGITRIPLPERPFVQSASVFGDQLQQRPKTVAEFVERELMSAPKLTHRDYDPAKAFNVAAALRDATAGGKAGRMFEKRRQRADKFTVEGTGRAAPGSFEIFENGAASGGSAHLVAAGVSEL